MDVTMPLILRFLRLVCQQKLVNLTGSNISNSAAVAFSIANWMSIQCSVSRRSPSVRGIGSL